MIKKIYKKSDELIIRWRIILPALLLVIFIFNLSYNQSLGSITGSVIDKETHQPIPGANLILINTILGTASDQNGNFSIDNIPVGSYTIQENMKGYSGITRPNININSN